MKRFKRKYLSEWSIGKLQEFRTNGESFVNIVDRVVNFYDKNVILITDKKISHRSTTIK